MLKKEPDPEDPWEKSTFRVRLNIEALPMPLGRLRSQYILIFTDKGLMDLDNHSYVVVG